MEHFIMTCQNCGKPTDDGGLDKNNNLQCLDCLEGKEMIKHISVKLKKHENVIVAPEFTRSYEYEYEKKLEEREIIDAIDDCMSHHNLNGFSEEDLSEYEREDLNNLRELKIDTYSLDCGDYTYWIIIE